MSQESTPGRCPHCGSKTFMELGRCLSCRQSFTEEDFNTENSRILKCSCPKCGGLNPIDDAACWKCKTPITDDMRDRVIKEDRQARSLITEAVEIKAEDHASHLEFLLATARETGDWGNVPNEILMELSAHIPLTTALTLANHDIDREVEIITAECVFGMNIFRDVFAATRDFFGGRSVATQKVLRDARRTALSELKKEAVMVGADAVIAIDLDYQELSGGGKGGMLMLVASGTAVKLKTT